MDKPKLSADDLRKIAESVDGIRDKPAYVFWTESGPQVTSERPSDEDLILECETQNDVRPRPKFRSIALDPPMLAKKDAVPGDPGKPVRNAAVEFDALCWSEAAVDKFILPYYIRLNTPEYVGRILKAFNHPDAYAIAHVPLSDIMFLTALRTKGEALEALTLEEFEALL